MFLFDTRIYCSTLWIHFSWMPCVGGECGGGCDCKCWKCDENVLGFVHLRAFLHFDVVYIVSLTANNSCATTPCMAIWCDFYLSVWLSFFCFRGTCRMSVLNTLALIWWKIVANELNTPFLRTSTYIHVYHAYLQIGKAPRALEICIYV